MLTPYATTQDALRSLCIRHNESEYAPHDPDMLTDDIAQVVGRPVWCDLATADDLLGYVAIPQALPWVVVYLIETELFEVVSRYDLRALCNEHNAYVTDDNGQLIL